MQFYVILTLFVFVLHSTNSIYQSATNWGTLVDTNELSSPSTSAPNIRSTHSRNLYLKQAIAVPNEETLSKKLNNSDQIGIKTDLEKDQLPVTFQDNYSIDYSIVTGRLWYALHEGLQFEHTFNTILNSSKDKSNPNLIKKIKNLLGGNSGRISFFFQRLIILSNCQLLTIDYTDKVLDTFKKSFIHGLKEIQILSNGLDEETQGKLQILFEYILNVIDSHVDNIRLLLSPA